MASCHVQKEGLESTGQGQFVVSGYAELGCCPQNRSHTVHRGLGGRETGERAGKSGIRGDHPDRLLSPQGTVSQLSHLPSAWSSTLARYVEARVTVWGGGSTYLTEIVSSPSCLGFRHCKSSIV